MNPLIVDGALALFFFILAIATSFGQDIYDDQGVIKDSFREPSALIVLTALVTCAPVAVRRRWPLGALVVSSVGVLVHICSSPTAPGHGARVGPAWQGSPSSA